MRGYRASDTPEPLTRPWRATLSRREREAVISTVGIRPQTQTYPRWLRARYDRRMPKDINTNLQQAFAIKPEGVRLCPRGLCRRARRCLPPPAEELLFRCVVVPRKVWVRHRREILDIARRIYHERDAAEMAARQAADKAAKKATGR